MGNRLVQKISYKGKFLAASIIIGQQMIGNILKIYLMIPLLNLIYLKMKTLQL